MEFDRSKEKTEITLEGRERFPVRIDAGMGQPIVRADTVTIYRNHPLFGRGAISVGGQMRFLFHYPKGEDNRTGQLGFNPEALASLMKEPVAQAFRQEYEDIVGLG